MAESSRQMHKDFARWYQPVSLGDVAERRSARWDAIEGIVTDATRETVEALLRFAFGGRANPAPQHAEAIRKAFQDADASFDVHGSHRELQILAGATLGVLMEGSTQEGARASLAATTATFGGARLPDLPMNLGQLGEAAIRLRAAANRKRPGVTEMLNVATPRVDFSGAVKQIREQSDFGSVIEAFSLAGQDTTASLKALAQRQGKALEVVTTFLEIQDEELQILWWLFGQRSDGLDCQFGDIPQNSAPLVLASELADHTTLLPGPASVKGILSRAGLDECQPLPITTAVNSCPVHWLESLGSDAEDLSPLSTPIHWAIKRQLETGAGDAWVAGWAASTGIAADVALPPLLIGELFYRERLLLLFE